MQHSENLLGIRMGYKCNNNCVMCFFSDKLGTKEMATEDIKKNIFLAVKKGVFNLMLTGGEPTVRKDFLEVLSYAAEEGIREISVQTNGRMFFYEDFVRQIHVISKRLDKIRFLIPLYGNNKQLHDSITRSPGSFEQTVAGIKNLMKYDLTFTVKTVAIKQNYKNLPNIAVFLHNMGIKAMNISTMCVSERSKSGRYCLPRFRDIIPYLHKTAAFAKSKNFKIDIHSIPICIIPKYEGMINEKISYENILDISPDGGLRSFTAVKGKVLDSGNKMKPAKCSKCRLSPRCGGMWKKYFEIYGDGELKPFK